MNWRELYNSKKVSAEEAVSHIKSNTTVVVGHATGEPGVLLDALVANKEQYENVELIHAISMGKTEYCKPEMAKHFHHTAYCAGAASREAVNSERGGYITSFFYEFSRCFGKTIMVDVALIQLSPPDKHGYCSYGVSVDYTKPAAETAKLVIAEVNDQMPRTFGDSFIHVSELDYVVETSRPLIELKPAEITEVERAIAEHCASLIEDGSTLQVGIGAIPEAVCSLMGNKSHLGFYSEMIPDSVPQLVEAGVITNKCKGFHDGKTVAAFAMGTKKVYDWIDDNPTVEIYPCEYTNHPLNIMKNNKMVAINSSLQIDFTGQVVSESIGPYQMSSVGGQVDFVRGATMSPGGKAILAFTSTTAKGTKSKIVPFLDYGSNVTTSRNDADYIITEYGIAKLKGLRNRDRARALINIAHPKFRDELKDKFFEIFKTKF